MFAVSAPVPVLILNCEIWLERRLTTYRNFPEGAAAIETGSSPAENGEPETAARLPSGLVGLPQVVTTWLQMAKADTLLEPELAT